MGRCTGATRLATRTNFFVMDDTETLIAIVSSLLAEDESNLPQAVIMDALVQSNGDVGEALQLLRSKPGVEPSQKRKRVDLQNWLKPPSKKRREFKRAESTPVFPIVKTPKKQVEKPSSSSKLDPPVNLMSVLRQPPSPQAVLPKLLPMTLPSPDLVAKHTPCTLHLSVLPPELACRLFHTLMDKSKKWKRNKWWIFDRVVESPHLTSFFARETDGINDDQTWQEAAQYW